jgi:hypothetical protein
MLVLVLVLSRRRQRGREQVLCHAPVVAGDEDPRIGGSQDMGAAADGQARQQRNISSNLTYAANSCLLGNDIAGCGRASNSVGRQLHGETARTGVSEVDLDRPGCGWPVAWGVQMNT